jgi:hypothetical protein
MNSIGYVTIENGELIGQIVFSLRYFVKQGRGVITACSGVVFFCAIPCIRMLGDL